MHIHVIYPELTLYDKASNNVPFSGSPGAIFLHRTFDKVKDSVTYDVTLSDSLSSFKPLPDSRILILGQASLKRLNLGEINRTRGYVLNTYGRPAIATYSAFDCWSFKRAETDDADDDEEEVEEHKDIAPTKRSNYLAWTIRDFFKLVTPNWPAPAAMNIAIRPAMVNVLKWINNIPLNARIVLDIETRRQDHSLDCIGLADVDNNTGIVVPVYDFTNRLSYPKESIAAFWRALHILFNRPDVTIIGHNLAFDLSILSAMYLLPLPQKIYDTMLAMHREFPTTEKSLSHAISYYTFASRNHKADIAPNTSMMNQHRLMTYNGEDIRLTAAVYRGQLARQLDPGLLDAVALANELQLVTLEMSLTGINVDKDKLEIAKDKLRLKDEQLTRCVKILTGIPEFNPGSTQQVANYFYRILNYEVPEVTESGAPSSSTKALYKVQTAKANPLIPLIIEIRETRKLLSMFSANLYTRTCF